jgi:hypothetical protein
MDAKDSQERERAGAGVVLVMKNALSQLHYDVSFDRLSLPSADGEFCSALTEFEQNAELEPGGQFTVDEFNALLGCAFHAS